MADIFEYPKPLPLCDPVWEDPARAQLSDMGLSKKQIEKVIAWVRQIQFDNVNIGETIPVTISVGGMSTEQRQAVIKAWVPAMQSLTEELVERIDGLLIDAALMAGRLVLGQTPK